MSVIIIDGKQCEIGDASSVLEVALANGVFIPTLCHNRFLSDYGACRLCLVEVIRKGQSKVTASCTLPPEDGMEIATNTERVARLRRLAMELILASCPQAPVVREMAEKLGAGLGRLETDPSNDCVRCGLCVRACAEISAKQAISFTGRGVHRKVATPFDEPSADCVLCGACVSVCPTGSRLLDLARISGRTPEELLSEFDAGLRARGAIDRPFPQALPNVPAINRDVCLRLNTDGCGICKKVCKASAINFDDQDAEEHLDVGAVVVAPGFNEFLAQSQFDFGYSRFQDVVTSMEFERILSASGPHAGHVHRISDGKAPERIAFLQCIGSRDISCRNGYCSSVCCMYAIKEAVIAKEHMKGVDVTIFFMDIRAFGKDFDKYYERAKSEYGVRFVRARVSCVERSSASGSLTITYAGESGGAQKQDFDMVILSVGLEPNAKMRALAGKLGVRMEPNGFIWTDPMDPLQTSREGVFVGGAASGPKDIPETVVQASGAAGRVMQLLAEARGSLTTEKRYPPERDIRGEPPRIGVFVCHCGINIGGVVNVPEVAEFAATLPNVAHAEHNLYTCSQDAQDHIRKTIQERGLNRIVVASCSPRTHEPLFQETLRESGLNPHLFEMANIRDQCSWVHMNEPEKATEKAKNLVSMAAAKVVFAEPLYPEFVNVTPSALVVGGGVAGMKAALSIAEQGFPVTLIEREKRLGGNLLKLTSVPDEPDAQAWLRGLAKRVSSNRNISVLLSAELTEVDGFVGNFESTIRVGGKNRKIRHGAVVLATGGRESKPEEYLYGRDDDVVTQLELERMLADAGTVGGRNRKSKIENRKSVVMIQCAGSREQGHMYCSRLCCGQAVKNALRIKELSPVTEVYILYRDMRTYGFTEERFQDAREAGVIFVRYEPESKPVVDREDGALTVRVYERLLARELLLRPDLLALSSRIDPDPGNAALSRLLKVPLNEDRFFLEAHAKLRPVEFATEGVFVAGLAHGPKTLPETISQAEAAAAKACVILSKKSYQAEPRIARVDVGRCAACGTCESVCAYKAIEVAVVNEGTGMKSARVNSALCKGCGTCAATCRSGALDVKGITDHQVDLLIRAGLS